ncbi:MAG: ATP-binding protein [Terriglobales bacterium]|jgi:two-component system NtrC family sensor kinase
MPTEENGRWSTVAGRRQEPPQKTAEARIGWDPKSAPLLPEPEPDPAWKRRRSSLSVKLIALIFSAMVVIFALLGYANIRLHRQQLEAETLTSAERTSDVIKRSTSYYMLRNDREALYRTINTMADEPGIVKIRIFDKEGRIEYSSDPREVNRSVDKRAEACYACHAQAQPLAKLNRPDRFRIYRANGSGRVLGIINPIENEPACSNAACHAHPASQHILGVLDTNLSLAKADAGLAESTRLMLIYIVLAVIVISVLTGVFVLRLVHRPVRILKRGTEELAKGDLGYQIAVESTDELGDLANSFNVMSLQLRAANEEITSWARTLETRVEDKTNELKRAHEHMLQVEKMASIGKMAAVVAHEINNPLSGILTYAKLLKKWIQKVEGNEQKRVEIRECLDLVESESKRCGDLVKNLLMFSRTAPMNLEWADVNMVVDRCIRLVQHHLDLGNVQLQVETATDLPLLHCDPAQVEQVLLALVMNAIDAMPRGGNLMVRTRSLPQSRQIEIQVRDDGVGIPPDLLPRMFEPFLTTKETGKGVGLGLAISKTIVERHGGVIEVESQPGRGTTFYIFLPVDAVGGQATPAEEGAANKAGS